MAQYQGKVSKLFESRRGGSFGLADQYGLYFNTKNDLPPFVVPGATVSFEAEVGRNGKSCYVVDSTLKEVVGAPKPAPGGTPTGFGTRDDSIKYQSSRKDALVMVGLLAAAGALYNDKTPKAKLAGIIEDTVDRFTALYYEDIETLGALERAGPAEKEIEIPVPQPATPAPAGRLE